MIILRSVLVAMFVVVAGLNVAFAADQTPKQFLDKIYANYVGKDTTAGMPLDKPATRKLFTPGLLKLIDADARRAAKRGDVPTLDGDPFVDAQDWQIPSYTIDIQDDGNGKATGTVKFKNADQDQTVILVMVRSKDGWHIDDISSSSGTLRTLLGKK